MRNRVKPQAAKRKGGKLGGMVVRLITLRCDEVDHLPLGVVEHAEDGAVLGHLSDHGSFAVPLLHLLSAENEATTLFMKVQRVMKSIHGDLSCMHFGHRKRKS
jgi:hypothetical protein